MQNFARRLMSGASLALLAIGGLPASTARAAGRTIQATTLASVTVTFPQEYDYILVSDDGHITGNFLNEGFVGLPSGDAFGIKVEGAAGHPASIGGNITNEQVIVGSSTSRGNGILIVGPDATLGGDILNRNNGDIVAAANAATHSVAGIAIISGAHFGGYVQNSGQIHAGATISGAHHVQVEGIRIDTTGALFSHTDVNEAGGVMNVKGQGSTGATVTARGYDLGVHGNISAAFVNNGQIEVTASDVGGRGEAFATGARLTNNGGTLDSDEFGDIENEGLIQAHAFALATSGDAYVGARGVDILVQGAFGTSNTVAAHVGNDGKIAAKASMIAVGGSANATGINIAARAGFHVNAAVTNDHLIEVSAIDHGLGDTAAAAAHGVWMDASSAIFATNKLDNQGTIKAAAFASAADSARARATGVLQEITFASVGHNTVTNDGKISARATASAIHPSAVAHGIVQTEFAVASYTNKVVNNGSILAFASANDVGGDAVAKATGLGLGSKFVATTTPCGTTCDPKNVVTNHGLVKVSAFAHGVAATAQAIGENEHIIDVGIAENNLINSGTIVALASAHASLGDAKATATGVVQAAHSILAHASNTVDNNGIIGAHAKAVASFIDSANANAVGVLQTATGHGTAAAQHLTNDGVTVGAGSTAHFVPAKILATATASGYEAGAHASGVAQRIYNFGTSAENTVFNEGVIGAAALANGVLADATAVGVKQRISSTGVILSTAKNILTNDGSILAHATAHGEAEAGASATGARQYISRAVGGANQMVNAGVIYAHASATGGSARAYAIGVTQSQHHVDFALNELGNNGAITATAFARAETGDTARATATAVNQAARTVAVEADNTVDNTGYIAAHAKAENEEDFGSAYAGAYGVQQAATGAGAAAAQHLTNDGYMAGTGSTAHFVPAKIFATASASGYEAHARASAVTQYIYGFASAASNAVINEGHIAALAVADGALAEASAIGIGQNIAVSSLVHVTSAKNAVTNHGTVSAHATAHGGYDATAHATGIGQHIAYAGTGHNFVSNPGIVYAHASASAFAAEAKAKGVVQGLSHVGLAVNEIINGGTIEAIALAHSGEDFAAATATAVVQSALHVAGFATNEVDSNGIIAAHAAASGSEAHAIAAAVIQNATGSGLAVVQKVTNDGHIIGTESTAHFVPAEIMASATASGFTARAHAGAIAQHAAGFDGSAENSVINDGEIVAAAKAVGSHAQATAIGIQQNVAATSLAHVSHILNLVTNSGTIGAHASAHGDVAGTARATAIDQNFGYATDGTNVVYSYGGDIYARASAGGVRANAFAKGVIQSQSFVDFALNKLVSHGDITAVAVATGLTARGTASAVAQHVEFATKAKNSVSNYGEIKAFATAAGHTETAFGKATAKAYGVKQGASFVDSATNVLVNHGYIEGYGAAYSATRAVAKGSGEIQSLHNVEFALNEVENSGFIGGFAYAAGSDSAKATAIGVTQVITDAAIARNSVTNAGTIEAYATAKGGAAVAKAAGLKQVLSSVAGTNYYSGDGNVLVKALASDIGHRATAKATGILQSAHFIDTAYNTVKNGGDIVVSAKAVGSTIDSMGPGAKALGVHQSAFEVGEAFNYLTNAGMIEAKAHGSATAGDAEAIVYAAGVYQNGTAEDYVKNSAVNDGFLSASAIAKAHGFASAYATALGQFARAGISVENAGANNGTIRAFASADAYDAAASAGAYGVNQFASADDAAENFFEISGRIFATARAEGSAGASAVAYGVRQYADADSAAHNFASGEGYIAAKALAEGENAQASAFGINQVALADGLARNTVFHNGTIVASARASGYSEVYADASGIYQDAEADTATNDIENSGRIEAFASAAEGLAVSAKAYGVNQYASGSALAQNRLEMDGRITATAHAQGGISAFAVAFGVRQFAGATTTAQNFASAEGYIAAKAGAGGGDVLDARAGAFGISQVALASGFARNTVFHNGTIVVSAIASGYSKATATASGIYQKAEAGTVSNEVENSGEIEAYATAYGEFHAKAYAAGINQVATGTVAAETGLGLAAANYATNYGYIRAKAYARASDATTVSATADATGIRQYAKGTADGDVVRDEVINRGSIYASAHAVAVDGSTLHANATAVGIYEDFDAAGSAIAIAHNSGGYIDAYASASVAGGDATAHATAVGIGIRGTAPKVNVDVMNSGHIYATASAYGSHATAAAFGIGVENKKSGGVVSGNIVNSGEIEAGAYAPGGYAFAAGIGVKADQFVGQIENNGGLVEASAVGAVASAAAIVVTNNGHAIGTGVGEIVNDGGELAAYINGKAGWAIALQNAPNEVDVTLEGDGTIYGNIGLQNADVVTVENGETYLDGIVNPSPLGNVGTFNVSGGATLYLPNAPSSIWGVNAAINVNNFNQAGTLELDVDAANASGIALHNAQIHANNADLTGGSVLINTQPGLYPNSITYQVVFGALGGTQWSSVALAPTGFIPVATPFFTLAANYPSASEADVVMTRTPFNKVPGLTPNERGVGTGLEGGYSTSLTGAAEAFYESILTLTGSQYPQALDMLSDEEAGEMAFINTNFARDFMDMLSAHTGLSGSASSMMASLSQPAPYQVASLSNAVPVPGSDQGGIDPRIWGAGFGSWENTKTTISGPGYTVSDDGAAAGFDVYADNNWLLGVAGAYAPKTPVQFGSYGTPTASCPSARPNACNPVGSVEGFEVGAYSRYNDDMGFYLAGNFAYGNYKNTTQRFVSLPSLGSGFLSGKFTSDVWSVYGEGGYPLDMGSGVSLTPYVGVSYINSNSGAFSETGALTGGSTVADLRVTDASSTSVQSYVGGQLGTSWDVGNGMTLMPNVRAAWAHEFESDIWNVDAYFSGIGPTSGFGPVTGGALSKNSGIVDANFGLGITNNVSATFGYEGRFSNTDTNNFFFGRLNILFP